MLNNLRHLTGSHCLVLLTRKCNLNCSYCNVIRKDYSDVEPERWFKEIDSFNRYNVTNVSVLGGEPTEYDGLFQVLEYMKKKTNATVSLVTNTIKIRSDGEYQKKLGDVGLDSLVVSINNLSDLNLLDEIHKNYNAVIVNTVISKTNISEIGAMIKNAAKYRNVFFNPIMMQVDENLFSKKTENLMPGEKELKETSKALIKMKLGGYPIMSSISYLKKMPEYSTGWRWKCDPKKAFNRFFVLNNDTRIMVCPSKPPLEYSLSELNEENTDEFMGKVKSVVESCDGCFFDCIFNSSLHPIKRLLNHVPYSPRILKNL